MQFAALDTLHDGLAGHAVGEGGLQHGQPAVGGVVDEQVADVVGEPDAPGRAGGELLAGDKPIAEPTVQGGGRRGQFGGGLGHGEQLCFGRVVGGCVAGDFVVVAQRLDPTGGERQAAGGAAALPVEDVGDHRVGIVGGQTAHQVDGVLVGAQPVGRFAFDRYGQVGDGAAFPAQHQLGVGVGVVAIHGDVDLVEQAAQQLFAVLVGGGRRRPYAGEIVTEREDR